MKYIAEIFILIFALTVLSCSAGNIKTGNDYVIKYINLNSVYEYIYNNSNEAQEIKRKIDSLNKKIEDMENSGSGGSKTELNHYKNEISREREREKKLKSVFHSRIKTAVNSVAAKHNADFVLNSGDGVIYSRPVYDITDDVIRELKSITDRTSPVYK
jgi:Skp family chaperone for outer membrane proteins